MKKILISITMVLGLMITKGFAQTSGGGLAGGSGSSSGTQALTSFIGQGSQNQQQGMYAQTQNLLVSILGNMLRDPNVSVRKEALMSIIAAITSNNGNNGGSGSNNNNGNISSIFSMNSSQNGGGSNSSNGAGTTSGLGGAAFIPDLYTLLSDPDHEVRALAAVAIDEVFGSDVTLMNYLKSPDPIVRKYALELIVVQGINQAQNGGNNNNNNSNNMSKNMLTLRILLKMLNDPDPGVREVAQQAINIMVNYGISKSGKSNIGTGSIFSTATSTP
ncbi:MAG: hypothetical protein M1135_01980 [Candidatus Omnitrophica bacterium]|nr:hypothetical protein [Candidatus Omnitrophota bacterium]